MAGHMDLYLQEADWWSPEDLNVGGVGVGQLQSVSQPDDGRITGMSFDLTADIHCIPLPGIHCHFTMYFRGI